MDTFTSFFDQRSRTSWSTAALGNLRALSPKVQNHLRKVYLTLCAALVVAAAGVYCHLAFQIGGLITHFGFIGASIWLSATPPIPSNEGKRLRLMMAAAFFQGCSTGNLVETVLSFDPSIILSAFLGTVAIFGCFSGAALVSKRREFLFLGGIISSAVSLLLVTRFASFFVGGSAANFQLELYGGLLIFVGYVLFDTQVIVEKADRGDLDYVRHSLDLFIDFVAIFVRLVIILTKNTEKRHEKDRKSNTRRR